MHDIYVSQQSSRHDGVERRMARSHVLMESQLTRDINLSYEGAVAQVDVHLAQTQSLTKSPGISLNCRITLKALPAEGRGGREGAAFIEVAGS